MKNKPFFYNRQSYRLKNYDYSREGIYFVTICCKNQQHLFGKVLDNEIFLSDLGKIAHEEWLNTTNIRDNIRLHDCVVMPNHIHAIIEILFKKGNNHIGEFRSPSQSLGSIIRGYKIAVIKRYRDLKGYTGEINIWQSRFYDVIIRDEKSYNRICNYIKNNPKKWCKKYKDNTP